MKEGFELYALVGQMGYLTLSCAVLQVELYFYANFMLPGRRRMLWGSGIGADSPCVLVFEISCCGRGTC